MEILPSLSFSYVNIVGNITGRLNKDFVMSEDIPFLLVTYGKSEGWR